MRTDLIIAMLRRHRAAYVGLALVLVVAATLVSSSFALLAAAQPHEVRLDGLSRNATAKLLILLGNGRFASTFMVVVAAFVTVLLVAQTMGYLVEGRRREFGLLRLSGAAPAQVRRTVLGEAFGVGSVCSAAGAMCALPLVAPYASLLSAQHNWPTGVTPRLHLEALVWGACFTTGVAVLGSMAPAWRVSRCSPMDAVRHAPVDRARLAIGRWVLAGAGGAVMVASVVSRSHEVSYQVSTAALGAGAVLVVSALVPGVVVAVARSCGRPVMALAPAAVLVARERVIRSAGRASALVTPVVALLAFGAVFGALAQTGRVESASGLHSLQNVRAVVERSGRGSADRLAQQIAAAPEVQMLTTVRRADDWAWSGRGTTADDFPELMAIDPDTFVEFTALDVDDGDIEEVRGRNVAALSGSWRVGDRLALEAPDGGTVTVSVVATLEPTSFVYGTLLVDAHGLMLPLGDTEDTVLVAPAEGVSDRALVAALRRGFGRNEVLSADAWIDRTVAESVMNQRASIATIIGGATVLALANLAQVTLAAVRERRDEAGLLLRLGASRRTVIATSVLEVVSMISVAALLAVGVTVAVITHLGAALDQAAPGLAPAVPLSILVGVLLACALVAVGTAAAGARWMTVRMSIDSE